MTQSPPRVLVIDDDQWFAELQLAAVQRAGMVPVYAADVLAGIAALDEALPAVIILDMFMPGGNGLVLLHELQSYSDTARIPIIICSNNASDMTLTDLAPYGVVALLDKTTMRPSDVTNLLCRYIPSEVIA